MKINKKDQKKLLEKYGYMSARHFEGDKTLEERIKQIDEEYDSGLRFGQQFGSEYVNWYTKNIGEHHRAMKEDLKELYNK